MIIVALEPRIVTRWDIHKYARDAYKMGIRYIGGCCGFEPYHIRAIAEEVRFLFILKLKNLRKSLHGTQCDIMIKFHNQVNTFSQEQF